MAYISFRIIGKVQKDQSAVRDDLRNWNYLMSHNPFLPLYLQLNILIVKWSIIYFYLANKYVHMRARLSTMKLLSTLTKLFNEIRFKTYSPPTFWICGWKLYLVMLSVCGCSLLKSFEFFFVYSLWKKTPYLSTTECFKNEITFFFFNLQK